MLIFARNAIQFVQMTVSTEYAFLLMVKGSLNRIIVLYIDCDHDSHYIYSYSKEWICWPDHVKNLAGICVPTCPTGKSKE